MGKEIERKFLLTGDAWKTRGTAVYYRQGYLHRAKECAVRVRICGGKAFLTIKGRTTGVTRAEFEYEIPLADAEAMLDTLAEKPLVEKNRYTISHAGLVWEVDEFLGLNAGLVLAEVELAREDQLFGKPDWVGDEVSDDPRYFNANLVAAPYSTWQEKR